MLGIEPETFHLPSSTTKLGPYLIPLKFNVSRFQKGIFPCRMWRFSPFHSCTWVLCHPGSCWIMCYINSLYINSPLMVRVHRWPVQPLPLRHRTLSLDALAQASCLSRLRQKNPADHFCLGPCKSSSRYCMEDLAAGALGGVLSMCICI